MPGSWLTRVAVGWGVAVLMAVCFLLTLVWSEISIELSGFRLSVLSLSGWEQV